MIFKYFLNKLALLKTKVMMILIINSFSWYFPLYIFFVNVLDSLQIEYNALLVIYLFHYLAIIVSAFIGNILVRRFNRYNLLLSWMIIGILASLSVLLTKTARIELISAISILLGLSLGLGFPTCLAYFADNVDINHRGSVGGFVFFMAFIGMCIIGFLSTVLSYMATVLFFTIWRGVGLAIFMLFNSKNFESIKVTEISYKAILHKKSFVLYYIPWIMFCLVNFLEIPFFDFQLQQYFLGTNVRYLISISEFGIGGLSAMVCGLLSDLIGRKRIIIFAYTIVGIGYAALSFAFSSPFIFYLYVVLDGVAWGVFALMFYFIIWGDIAENYPKEKIYLLGTLPFLISSFLSFFVTPYAQIFPLFTAFSLASFFLFLAVIPLMYAPETLPEKTVRERELRSYIEKAKRIREKFTKG
jgi:MFS family permease